jgi:predicted O-methyltransferase YrrM
MAEFLDSFSRKSTRRMYKPGARGWRISNTRRLRTIIRSLFYALITTRISVKFAVAKLRRETNKCKRIGDCVDLAFKVFNVFPFRLLSIRPAQVEEEITELLRLFAKHEPKFLLEIGTAKGGTLFLLARVSSPDAMIISIDLPSGRFGGGYPEWRKTFYELFATCRQNIHLIREDSHALATLNMVKKALKGRKLDLLFIDGDHTYKGVKRDFEMYNKLVTKGGIIAFHDVCPHLPQTGCEVDKFWCEIKDEYEHVEIVRDWKQGWAGIGVLYV